MRLSIVFGTACAALCLAGSSWAQTSTDSRPDPTKLQLAHQLIEASGGEAAYKARLQSMVDGMRKLMAGMMPADAAATTDVMVKYIAEEEAKAAPQILDQAAEVYAEHLTQPELRAMLAWTSSDIAQSIQRKSPAITQDILLRQGPMIRQMLPGILQRSADRACAEAHCTPEVHQQIVAAMSLMLKATGDGKAAARE